MAIVIVSFDWIDDNDDDDDVEKEKEKKNRQVIVEWKASVFRIGCHWVSLVGQKGNNRVIRPILNQRQFQFWDWVIDSVATLSRWSVELNVTRCSFNAPLAWRYSDDRWTKVKRIHSTLSLSIESKRIKENSKESNYFPVSLFTTAR